MDLNDIRIAVTLVSLALFVALAVHTFSRRRRAEHEAAAALPFIEDGAEAAHPVNPRGERRE